MGKSFIVAAVVSGLAAGCLHSQPGHVEGGVLGRVVIYRNGVAFYERRAQVIDGRVAVQVPRERVDDFLKSLTVVDPATHRPLAVTIPRQQSESGSFLTMTLETGERTRAEVLLTYVTEAPAWKPSYRVVLGTAGKVELEGWAIVDNTTSEDWNGVLIGVGASSALAFRYDLWSVRRIDRDLLAGEDRLAIAPPSGVSPYSTAGAQELGSLDASEVREGDAREGELVEISGTAPAIDPTSTKTGVTITQDYVKTVPVPGRTFEGTLGSAAGSQPDTTGVSFAGSSSLENQYVVEGVNSTSTGETGEVISISSGGSGSTYRAPKPPPPVRTGDDKLRAISKQVIASHQGVIVEVSGAPSEAQSAASRGNAVKAALVDAGVPAGSIHVVTKLADGRAPGVRMLAIAPDAAPETRDLGPDAPVGESHFFADRPMTVKAGTSAMVSMVHGETTGGVAYLYDPVSERGDQRYAFKSVRLDNPTTDTLEPGPVTVYGEGRFIGEGITEPVPPHASVVVPFALDKQVVVACAETEEDRIAQILVVARGRVTADLQHRRTSVLTLTSRLGEATTVYVRHRLDAGWTMVEAPANALAVGDSKLYAVPLSAGATTTITLIEAMPTQRSLALGSSEALDLLTRYLEDPHADAALVASVAALLATHRKLADLDDRMGTLRDQLGEYRSRSRELAVQLVALKAVKTSGPPMATLRGKLAEMSSRAQAATIALVDAQDQQMMERVRLQNQLADLHLAKAPAVSTR